MNARHLPVGSIVGSELLVDRLKEQVYLPSQRLQSFVKRFVESLVPQRFGFIQILKVVAESGSFSEMFPHVPEHPEKLPSRRAGLCLEKWTDGQFECTLFAGHGDFFKYWDGYHPAGAVIDAERAIQHIFFYSGHPNGPAGTFRLSRSLDTPRLAEFLNARPGRPGSYVDNLD